MGEEKKDHDSKDEEALELIEDERLEVHLVESVPRFIIINNKCKSKNRKERKTDDKIIERRMNR